MNGTVAGFTLQRPIGAGAMGEVWRAVAPDGTVVALKVARPMPRDASGVLRRIEGEIRALARLDHPGVAWLYDHGRTGADGPFEPDLPYLVLEHCGGGTLEDRTFDDWPAIRDVLVGLLEALAHAHAHGVVHRDLKPSNVLWAGPTDVRPGMKLADFGIAVELTDPERSPRAGTPWYLAPEQVEGPARVGPWTDLYALGAVAWELLTGDPPHLGTAVREVIASIRRGLPRFRPTLPVPDAVEAWLRSLLDPDPAGRPRRAAAALSALARIDPAVPAPGRGWRAPRPSGPRLRLQGAGLNLVGLREPDLAGRTREREVLWTELCAACDARALRVVVMRGISGIGKSRLGRWLAVRAAELGVAEPIAVGCREGGALLALLAALTGVPPGGDRAEAVEEAIRARDPAAATRLGPLLRAGRRPWGTVPMVRRLVVRAAEHAPVVLVLDDAQDSLDAVRFARALLADGPQVPLLVVLAVEEEALGAGDELADQLEALCDTEGVTRLAVGPLTAAEQQELLESLVALDPESQSAVLARAGGHPGTVVAQVTSWAGEGALAPSRRGFRLVTARRPPAEGWSATWARWMTAWLGTVDPADRLLLEQAAVIGRSVDEGLWERVSDDPGAVMPVDGIQIDIRAARARAHLVDRLIAAGLAYDTDTGFTFTHPALVEVLIAQARDGGRLAALHRACANHLRRMPQPDHALALGAHLAAAGVWDQAATALLEGIEHHWKFRDRRPLLTEVDRAARCVEAAGWAEDDPRRADLLHTRAQVLLTAGKPDEAAVLARRAWAMARRTGDRARIARTVWRLVGVLVIVSRWDEAMEVIPAFLEVEDACEEPAHRGLARSRMARALRARGDRAGAARWFAEAERVLLDLEPSVWSLGALLELYGFVDRPERILEVGAELDRLAFEEGRTDLHLFSMSKQVEALLMLERFAEGIELARACLRLNDQLGDQRFSRYMRVELGVLELRDGRFADAVRTLTDVLAVLDRHAFTWLALTALLARAEALLAQGDPAALEALDRDVDEVARVVSLGRYERDALVYRLRRLSGQLAGAGLAGRAERVDAVLRRVTDAAPTEASLDPTPPR